MMNILKMVILFGLLTASLIRAEEGFTPIFDGKTLEGWAS